MKEVTLTKGFVAKVDDEDFDRVNQIKWHASAKGSQKKWYAQNKNNTRFLLMHRFIMNPPDDMVIDHLDGDGLNNQKSNLEIVTFAENYVRSQDKRKQNRDDICL